MKRVLNALVKVAAVGAFAATISSVTFGSQASDAAKVADAFEQAAGGGATCSPRYNSRTIMCIVNASDREADKIARGMVLIVSAYDVNLSGWKLTLVTLNDYVVTQRF